jgi:hypothetical protein
MVDKAAMGQFFSEHFGFPYPNTFAAIYPYSK